ncbi:substrate-binding periplasmic protein [Magnetospirillum moscoviense]|nr:transporter substrate-binding domain-containing protein [Magnetospirillum moscoviense]
MRAVWALVAMLLGMMAADGAPAAQLVKVGGYEFPPFVEADGKGLVHDVIAALNAAQTAYEFRFVPVAARRRYADLADARFDVMFFESPDWEWTQRQAAVDFTAEFLQGGEVFVAQARPGRGQDFFASLTGKRLVGILGYHYGFADFNADPERLARDWGMKLVANHKSSIDMVLADRADLAVVTDSYLWAYLSKVPEAREKLLVSDRFDQVYRHRALVRRLGPIDVKILDGLLARLERDGTLARTWRQGGIVR